MYKIIKVNNRNKSELSVHAAELKSQVDYPLGDDKFNIVHASDDYFLYYERMGVMHYWCMFDDGKLVATICVVIKTINSKKIAYLCDLKVIKGYRKQGIARKLFRKALFYTIFRCRVFKMFSISLDESQNSDLAYQKNIRISGGFLKKKAKLIFFMMSKHEYLQNLDILSEYAIVNTAGIKDIVFHGLGKMDLYHLNKDRIATTDIAEIDEKASFVISAYEKSNLAELLFDRKFLMSGSATVLGFGINLLPYIPSDEV